MLPNARTHDAERLAQIARARSAVLLDRSPGTHHGTPAWVERSWRRCLAQGRAPHQRVAFDVIPAQAMRRVEEANHVLVKAAKLVLKRLSRAIASTNYFAILTNESGVVVDAHGPVDRRDRRASLITRIGVDLSEAAVGTTAIGAALAELQPVWLHRGEHFFDDTGCYSCAGAPLFGPDGRCIGMLDLTGIDAAERPELKHLVAQSARGIEDALVAAAPHRLLLRLNWPGRAPGGDGDGLVALDAEGWVKAANPAARQMLPQLESMSSVPIHCSELFAQSWEPLFDADAATPIEVALWSGLRLLAVAVGAANPSAPAALRDVEIALIRRAVEETRGNVARAAELLGISRATVYRKLSRK